MMHTNRSLVLAMAVLLSAVSLEAAEGMTLPRVGGIKIDGDGGDWRERGLRVVAFEGDGARLPAREDFAVTARLGWDEEGLLALVEVWDDVGDEQARADLAYERDSVELKVALTPDAASMAQMVVSPGTSENQPEARVAFFDYRGVEERSKPLRGTAARTITRDGYVVEMRFPWGNLGRAPGLGDTIGCRLQVNDHDGEITEGRYRYSLADERGPRAALTLSETAEPSELVQAWMANDGFERLSVHVVAGHAWTGRRAGLLIDGEEAATGELVMHGAAATMSFHVPVSARGEELGDFAVRVGDGEPIDLREPDVDQQRMEAWEAITGRAWDYLPPHELMPQVEPRAFEGRELPRFIIPAWERLETVVGAYQVRARYFANDYSLIAEESWTSAGGPGTREALDASYRWEPGSIGRVGLVVDLEPEDAAPKRLTYTLFDLPAPSNSWHSATTAGSPELLAGLYYAEAGADVLPSIADGYWWHGLREKLGEKLLYKYRALLPEGYTERPEEPYPLIIILHGSGRGETTDERAEIYMRDRERELEGIPAVAIVPFTSERWEAPKLELLLDTMLEKYPVDPERVSFTGFSMGGYGSLEAATAFPERLAAIAPVAGSASLASAYRMRDLPVYFIASKKDEAVRWDAGPRPFVERLKSLNPRLRLKVYETLNHGETRSQGFSDGIVFNWLLEQKRGEPAQRHGVEVESTEH